MFSKNKVRKNAAVLFTVLLIIFMVNSFTNKVQSYTDRHKIIRTEEYVVQKCDTLSQIAEKFKPKGMNFNNYLVEVQVMNNIREHIEPGDIILIPIER